MTRRWGVNTRLWAYRYLAIRDGEQCGECGILPTTQNALDIDHLDGDPKNNRPDNLRLLCRACNTTLGNKARPSSAKRERERKEGKPATRIVKEDAGYRQGSPEMKANLLYEVSFRRWLMSQVSSQGGYPKKEAIAEGAELVGCSPLTTARYIEKLTSKAGPLREGKDLLGHTILVLKPELEREHQQLDSLDTSPSIPLHPLWDYRLKPEREPKPPDSLDTFRSNSPRPPSGRAG